MSFRSWNMGSQPLSVLERHEPVVLPVPDLHRYRPAELCPVRLGPLLGANVPHRPTSRAGGGQRHGQDRVQPSWRPLGRAVEFGRFRATDVRSILAAGTGVPRPCAPGDALIVALPTVAVRSLGDYAVGSES